MNVAKKQDVIPVSVVEQYVKLLSPFAPHAAEELWSRLGHDESLTYQPWPIANETYLQSQQSTISVHFNGKKRSLLTVDTSLTEDEVSDIVRTAPETESHFKTGTVKRVVYVPNKMINFIIG
jgi:leucyl-tRNA synthetase